MAMTASIALTPSSAKVGQKVTATLTVSNSGSGAVNLTSISPVAYGTSGVPATSGSSPIALGDLFLTPNTTISVPGSGSLKLTFPVIFQAPSNGTYSVGANCYSDDGSSFAPSPATITVVAP